MPDDRKLTAAERRALVVEQRRKRVPFDEIGTQLGISKQAAWSLYQRALRDIPAVSVAEHRAEETQLADDAVRALMEIANDPKVSARTRVEAWSAARPWSEHKAKLLGLNAPVRLEVSAEVDEQITALAAALAAGVGELEPAGEAEAAGDAEAG